MKQTKIIKASFKQPVPAKVELPPVNDLVIQFASQTTIYKISVPASEMGKLARAFSEIMKQYGAIHSIEEKPR